MSTVKANRVQLGQSATASQNFTLDASAADGTAKLARGNAGATTQDLMTVATDGKVDFPAGLAAFLGANQSFGANGYQKLPGGLIVQWGSFLVSFSTAPQVVQANITYPLPFPAAARVVVLTPWTTTPNAFPAPGAVLTNASQFQANCYGTVNNATQSYFWIALGN